MRFVALYLIALPFVSTVALADDIAWKSAFAPLPEVAASAENPITPQKVALGRRLYLDTRLSQDETISCNSCHNLKTFGKRHLDRGYF